MHISIHGIDHFLPGPEPKTWQSPIPPPFSAPFSFPSFIVKRVIRRVMALAINGQVYSMYAYQTGIFFKRKTSTWFI